MRRVLLISRDMIETAPKRAVLVLEDGTVFKGVGFGASRKVYGEVVFNTGMVGYPESITDPSYKGQILVQTYPFIGNYGVTPSSFESEEPKIEGYVIHELNKNPSHWSSELSLDAWLEKNDIPGIEAIDTRMLTKHIRTRGTMLGILQVHEELGNVFVDELRGEIKQIIHPNKMKLAYAVATDQIKRFEAGGNKDIVLVDCGVKSSIIRNILDRKFNVVLVPPKTSANKILDLDPTAIVLSNGPGDPKMLEEVIATTRELFETKIPIIGICLGCQILALSLGADTYKLKFGHRGQNHPCIDLRTGRCYITSQNHGFAPIDESLRAQNLNITFVNANDRTIESFEHKSRLIRAFQFHPEASPGPNDTNFLFDEFFEAILNESAGGRHA